MNKYTIKTNTIAILQYDNLLTIFKKIAFAFGMAYFTSIMAKLQTTLPFTPVPITGQTFAVFLSGIILGKWWGGISQIFYIILGVFNFSWFAGFNCGVNALIGPTGGYLIGFVLSSFFISYVTETHDKSRNFSILILLLFFSNLFLIYVPGLIQLWLWLSFVQHIHINFWQLLSIGCAPFIIGDFIKILVIASIANIFFNKRKICQ